MDDKRSPGERSDIRDGPLDELHPHGFGSCGLRGLLIEARMFLPHMRLRKLWLRRALRDYPLYDPPHKVEERLLTREKAKENFDYFMRVRLQRLEYFRDWLRRYFGVTLTADEKGVRTLNRWGNKYAGFLLTVGPDVHRTGSYFTYEPPWTGENAGYNVVFDMGITLGEFIIASCPRLRWDFDPISAILPRQAERLKRTPGMSFQRPMLTGFDDPVTGKIPLHDVYMFGVQMKRYMTAFRGIRRLYNRPRGLRLLIQEELLNNFKATLRDYPMGDPYNLREQIGPENYLNFIDTEIE